MSDNAESRNKIGSLVGVTAHRIGEWASGKRVISPEKAFELGDALRSNLGWKTSGIEFLWACAYWPDVLAILKYLSADDDADGPDLAAMLYSWIPSQMFDFEIAEITSRFEQKHGIRGNLRHHIVMRELHVKLGMTDVSSAQIDLEFREIAAAAMESDPGAREVKRYFYDRSFTRVDGFGYRAGVCEALDAVCRAPGFQDRVARAWERYNNGELAASNKILAARVGTSATIARIEMDLVDTMIDAARNLNEAIFPSYAVPRIWRMSVGWVYEIAQEAAWKYSVALPDNFVNVPDVYERDEEERKEMSELEEAEEPQPVDLEEAGEASSDT